jgi:hypothetical protein
MEAKQIYSDKEFHKGTIKTQNIFKKYYKTYTELMTKATYH